MVEEQVGGGRSRCRWEVQEGGAGAGGRWELGGGRCRRGKGQDGLVKPSGHLEATV